MKKAFLIIVMISLFISITKAQNKEPKLLDTFGELNSEMLQARLDMLAEELRRNPDSFLQVMIRRGEKQSFGASYKDIAAIKSFWKFRRMPESQLMETHCISQKEKLLEFWLLNDKSDAQKCVAETFASDKTVLFDTVYPSMASCCIIDEFGDEELEASVNGFAEELKKHSDAKAYIYMYAGTTIFTKYIPNRKNPKTVREIDSLKLLTPIRQNVIKILTEKGIDKSRIIVKFGGYKESTRNAELWFVPKAGEIPKPTPNYFPKRKTKK